MFRMMLVLWCATTVAKEADVASTDEISHLLTFIQNSPCDFHRNGSWYRASEAVDHIKAKYEYFHNKGLIGTTEDFIELAATKSSMSGRYYMVKCADTAELKSGDWLRAELATYRESKQ